MEGCKTQGQKCRDDRGRHIFEEDPLRRRQHFGDKGVNVGLDFSFRFQAPVRLDDMVNMRWTMTGRMPKLSLKGDIVTLEGEAVRSDGIVAVSATAHVLLLAQEQRASAFVV